ncbi:MAG: citrinin biosynthesis oxidoreductase [Lasallia pustulata]|uniref:Citrinin biosynthesis oxidoreductase n=1 Tax=Lasallia pustulata TaxID=136370 RepID=A0A5M8PK65_9LECA|nr:MAG: citrinin biosynthesis oxidoreductase [Lasallia pustulata]
MDTTTLLETEDQTLYLPRILCLHGGGTNANIFRAQCRILRAELRSKFRLCFAEAPFPSQPGPDVVSVYKQCGPFRRWLRSGPEHPRIDPKAAVGMIEESLHAAMMEDDGKGATGEWVGLLGFSQGAKMCASLLFRQQVRTEKLGKHRAGSNYRFAVLMAGRGPLVSLDPDLAMNPALIDASQIGLSDFPDQQSLQRREHVLRLPTIHVHGLRDQGLELHRHLLEKYCDGSARLVEWDGNHRVPIKTKDVAAIVREIPDVAEEEGVFKM